MRALADSLLARVTSHGRELGCEAELEGIRDLLGDGNGALWQRMVYQSNHDLRELMAEIVAASAP